MAVEEQDAKPKRGTVQQAKLLEFKRKDATARVRMLDAVIETDETGKGRLCVDFEIDWHEGTERMRYYIDPPKPTPEVTFGPHRRISQRCDFEECNRLFPVSGRKDQKYCSNECYEAAKDWRTKQRRAGVTPQG